MPKLKLSYIMNNAKRRSSFKKRRDSILKKARELSTLCGVEIGVIIFNGDDSQLDVWPNTSGVEKVLEKFILKSVAEQNARKMSQEDLIRSRIAKAEKQLRKLQKENREKEFTEVMYRCLAHNLYPHNVVTEDLPELAETIDKKLREIDEKLASLKLEQTLEPQEDAEKGVRTSIDEEQEMN